MKRSEINKMKRGINMSGWEKFNDKVRFKIKRIKPLIGYEDCSICKEGYLFENLYKVVVEMDAEPFNIIKVVKLCEHCIGVYYYAPVGDVGNVKMSIDKVIEKISDKILREENNPIKEAVQKAVAEMELQVQENERKVAEAMGFIKDE